MSPPGGVGLPEALERAATALEADAGAIRPANGDPIALLEALPTDAAVRVLSWLLENEPVDAEELAEEWAEDPGNGSTTVLAVTEEGLPKPGRKALRRVRHRLRSRGVEVPEPEPAPTVATLPPVEVPIDEAVLSPLDPRGSRAAFLVVSHPAGGARIFELVVDEARGILDCRVYTAGRSKVRKFLKEFEGQGSAVQAPGDSVRAWISRVVAARHADRPAPRMFGEWRSALTDAPEGTATPGELARQALTADAGEGAIARAAELVSEGQVGPWPPESTPLQELAEKLGEVAEGKVVVSEATRREQADEMLLEALPGLFDEEFCGQTAIRFEETAYVLWKGDREEDARACLAAAAAFRSGTLSENPVARAMLERVLDPVLRKAAEEAAGEEASGQVQT